MFERFTERARKAIVLAQEEAVDLGVNYLGTEHILLGVLRSDFLKLPFTYREVKEEVDRLLGDRDYNHYGKIPKNANLPYTPRSRKIFELALREVLQLGHNYIGLDHIMLALLRETEGLHSTILGDFEVDKDNLAKELKEGKLVNQDTVSKNPVGTYKLANPTLIAHFSQKDNMEKQDPIYIEKKDVAGVNLQSTIHNLMNDGHSDFNINIARQERGKNGRIWYDITVKANRET